MSFSKNDTWIMKGFAIIFLYCYHCFSDYSRLSGIDVNFFPLSQKNGIYICESLNMCVGMFAFLSIFGMTLTVKKKYPQLKLNSKDKVIFVIKRYIGLIGGFIIPFIFCEIVSAAVGYYPYGVGMVNHVCNFLIDMFGLSMFFKTTMLTTTWWYLSLAVLFIVLFPLVLDLYRKYSILIIPMIGLGLLLWVRQIDNMSRWLFAIPLGICFADLELFQKIYLWIRKNQKSKWMKRISIYTIFVCLVYLRPHPWGLQHIKLIINSVIPVFMIMILYDIFHENKKINNLFIFLGKHSANMFYIHTFIRGVWLNKLTYSFRYAILILLFLLVTTVILSIMLEFLKNMFDWNSKVIMIKKRCIRWIDKV